MTDWNEIFYYDETSPSCLKWKIERFSGKNDCIKHIHVGDVAGSCKQSTGYWSVKYNKKNYQVHRVIYEIFNNEILDKLEVDHIDGNPSNNCIENLRLVSRSVNNRNRSMQITNTSGMTGVQFYLKKREHWNDPYWIAYYRDINGKLKSKSFNCRLLGYNNAYEKACKHREKMIQELNAQNAGYTERHGKEPT